MLPFSKKNKAIPIHSLIEANTVIDGNIVFKTGLDFRGQLTGDISSREEGSLLIVGKGAQVAGKVEVENIIVEGTIIGPVSSSKSIVIRDGGRVIGDVFYGRIQMDDGAAVDGRLVPHETVSAPPKAAESLVLERSDPAAASGAEQPALRPS